MFKTINKCCEKCGKIFKQEYYFNEHNKKCKITKEDIQEIQRLYSEEFLSIKDITIKKGYDKHTVEFLISKCNIKRRNLSESQKAAHLHHPESFKTSEKTKDKQRKRRIEYLRTHKFDNAWRRTNQSFIEKQFEIIINKNKLFEKYDIVREYSFFPYYLDYAFENIKLDVEVDGSQHWRDEEQKQSDVK